MIVLRAGTPTFAKELLKLLGLEAGKVRKITLSMEAGRPTVVEVEMFMTEDEASQQTETLATKRYEIRELE